MNVFLKYKGEDKTECKKDRTPMLNSAPSGGIVSGSSTRGGDEVAPIKYQ
jgi:hypothetical protein